jgi:potassium/hydrogen antiporter
VELSLGVDGALLAGAVLLLAAALSSSLLSIFGGRLRVPGALLFLVLGMVVGSDGLGLVGFDDPALVQNVGVVALLFILFEGGLTTKPTDLRLAALPGTLLATIGVIVTAGVTAVGCGCCSTSTSSRRGCSAPSSPRRTRPRSSR